MDRRYCSHPAYEASVLIVTWCERCCGWRAVRASSAPGLASAGSSIEVYESHFLPQEETSLDEIVHIAKRTFECAQTWALEMMDGQRRFPQ